MKKLLAVVVMLLFITISVIPSTGTVEQEYRLASSGNTLSVGCSSIELNNGRNGWNHTFGGVSYDEGFSVQQTSDGGYIITGATLSFGAGNWDVWLIKTDSTGSEQWNRTFGGSNYDRGSSVQQTNDGGYIIGGASYSYGSGDFDVWLIKTDSVGNEEWNYTFGGSSVDWGYSVQQTNDSGYIISGYTDSYGAGDSDVWLIKTDSNGNEVWNSTFGGINYDRGFSVQQTNDNGYIITGYTVSYDADDTGCDIWLIKTDANGIEEWNQTFGGTGISNKFDMGYSVHQTSDDGYIITGDTEIYYVAKSDIWLIKTDSSGNEVWNCIFGGSASDRGRSVQQTSDGGYIITGWATSYSVTDPDIWVIKTNSSGKEDWNYTYGFGENSGDWGYSVQQTTDGGYIIVGATMPSGWMITGSTASYIEEGTDVWLIKVAPEPEPDLCCEGSLSWEEVKPGATVTGTLQVCNCGEEGSLLNWQLMETPDWGIWEIEPDSGTDLAADDCVTITVNVTAPDDEETEFTGNVTMINTDNESDFCKIPVYLKTPKNKPFNFNLDLLEWLFERFPNAFPMIRYLLGM